MLNFRALQPLSFCSEASLLCRAHTSCQRLWSQLQGYIKASLFPLHLYSGSTRLTNTSPGLNNREICSKSGNALWARRQRRDLTLSPPSCRSALRAEMIHSSLHIWSRCECWKAAASGGETNPEKTDPSSVDTAESELHYERDKSTTSISNMD